MSQLAEIRRAVADRLRAAHLADSINVYEYPPLMPSLPCIYVLPSGGVYADYHGTFGALRLQEVNLIVRVMVPEGGSPQSADELLDGFLSSGTGEDRSLADTITGTDVPIGTEIADVYADRAEGWSNENTERGGTTPVVSCDIPVVVRVKRS